MCRNCKKKYFWLLKGWIIHLVLWYWVNYTVVIYLAWEREPINWVNYPDGWIIPWVNYPGEDCIMILGEGHSLPHSSMYKWTVCVYTVEKELQDSFITNYNLVSSPDTSWEEVVIILYIVPSDCLTSDSFKLPMLFLYINSATFQETRVSMSVCLSINLISQWETN